MKNVVKAVIGMSVIAFASAAIANPKCSHRVASSSNDLLKNTNPVRVAKVAKSTPQMGKESTKSGIK
ncbi:hypothetical protein QJS83_08430 [Bdellovibrio sp. 22V]|uniref:hypothetical protein n=1 Tax=Bdellovibrio TaxID=958 RepID=UPI0025428CD1|nr:hypothetical protein [Bdellovibrio sp. 22V]WII73900.1 hypothetical protein QJS83_08430 [Bdellovibrio sp. 22V]